MHYTLTVHRGGAFYAQQRTRTLEAAMKTMSAYASIGRVDDIRIVNATAQLVEAWPDPLQADLFDHFSLA